MLAGEVDHAAASPSCPRCGADCFAGAARCKACGFALVDDVERGPRRGGRAGRSAGGGGGSGLAWVVALGAAVFAVVAVAVTLFTGSSPRSSVGPADAGPPAAVSALEAEFRLEQRFGGHGDDETAAVRCPYRIEPGQLVRCELRYADGIARAMLVRLTPGGELDAAIPYPASLRR
jgi:hypothetical protein